MFEILQNTLFRACRAAHNPATGASGTAAPTAQKVPIGRGSARPDGAVLARVARPARAGVTPDFCAINAHEGRLVPVSMAPAGVLWRIHPASVAPTAAAGAAVAPPRIGARP